MALRAVPEHPKFARLKKTLGISKFEALGLLEALWHFTGKFAPRGNVGKFTNEEIESWLEWTGEPDVALKALIASGWIDISDEFRLAVHDWKDHADATTKKYMGRTKEGFVQDMSELNGKHDGPPVPVPVPEPVPVPVPEPEPNTLASTAVAVPASPAFITFRLTGKKTSIVTEADVASWKQAYPAVDVRQELRKILVWLDANEAKRSATAQGLRQRIVKWMTRAQDNGGNRGTSQSNRNHGKTAGNLDAFAEAEQLARERYSEASDDPGRETAGTGDAGYASDLLEGSGGLLIEGH